MKHITNSLLILSLLLTTACIGKSGSEHEANKSGTNTKTIKTETNPGKQTPPTGTNLEAGPFGSAKIDKEQICEGKDWIECRIAIEEAQLPKFQHKVNRNGKYLELILDNGQTQTLETKAGEEVVADEVIHFHFANHYAELNLSLINVTYYEGNEYLLVDHKTGQQFYTISKPEFSPSGKYIAFTNEDLITGYSTTGIQIFSLTEAGLKKEFEKTYTKIGPGKATWINDQQFQAERRVPDSSFNEVLVTGTLTYERQNGTWTVAGE